MTKEEEKIPAGMQALELLVNKLRSGAFMTGQPIRESVLAKEFELGRNAIREALNQLVGWDILEYVPYCGYRVRKFTPRDLLEVREVRAAIEPLAARRLAKMRPPSVIRELEKHILAFEKAVEEKDISGERDADLKFHLAIIENCGNRRFARMQNISYLIMTFFIDEFTKGKLLYDVANSTNAWLPERFSREDFDRLNLKLTKETHRAILDHIKEGDAEAAEQVCRQHTMNQVENLENIIVYYDSGQLEPVKVSF